MSDGSSSPPSTLTNRKKKDSKNGTEPLLKQTLKKEVLPDIFHTESFDNVAGQSITEKDKKTLHHQLEIFLFMFAVLTVARYAVQDYLFKFSFYFLGRYSFSFAYVTVEGTSFWFSSVNFVIKRFAIPALAGSAVALGPFTFSVPSLFIAFLLVWFLARIAAYHPYFSFFSIGVFTVITYIPFASYLINCYSTPGCGVYVDAAESVTSTFFFHNYKYYLVISGTVVALETFRHYDSFHKYFTNILYYSFIPFAFFAEKEFYYDRLVTYTKRSLYVIIYAIEAAAFLSYWIADLGLWFDQDVIHFQNINVALMNPVASFSLQACLCGIATFDIFILSNFKSRTHPLEVSDWVTFLLPLFILSSTLNVGLALGLFWLLREYFLPVDEMVIKRHTAPHSKLQQDVLSWFSATWTGLCAVGMASKVYNLPGIIAPLSIPVTILVNLIFVRPWKNSDKLWNWVGDHKLRFLFDMLVLLTVFVVAFGESALMPYELQQLADTIQLQYLNELKIASATIGVLLVSASIFFPKSRSPISNLNKLLLLSCIVHLFIYAMQGVPHCQYELGKEYLPKNAEETANELRAIVRDLVVERAKDLKEPAERQQHGKSFGCVHANFTVYHSLGEFETPLFKPGHSFPAYVRFSSSMHTGASDFNSVVNGMAVKLLNVHGEKILPSSYTIENNTQDFLFISHPVFFSRDLDTYPSLVKVSEDIKQVIGWTFPSWNPFTWRLETVAMILSYGTKNVFGVSMTNPLNWNYFSTTPYSFYNREAAVKYFVTPCEGTFNRHDDSWDLNYKLSHPDTFLRDNMANFLTERGVCFEFYIEEQPTACTVAGTSSVEDPTRPWHNSRRVRIGTINIPAQPLLYPLAQYCETLAFNPWHSVKEHKPLGAINFGRKPAYTEGAAARNEFNNVKPAVPTANITFSSEEGVVNMGNLMDFDYSSYEYETMPKYIKKVNPDQNFDVENVAQMAQAQFNYYMIETSKGLENAYSNFTTPDNFTIMFGKPGDKSFSPPLLEHSWRLDEIFARQFITGINPLMIVAYDPSQNRTSFPKAFNFTTKNVEKINNFLKNVVTMRKIRPPKSGDEGTASTPAVSSYTFESLKKERRLFFADYEIMQDIYAKPGRKFYSPLALFYLNEDDVLMPLAIQLTRNKTNNILYTPDDPSLVWLFARMHVMSADGHVHEMVEHLCFTHLTMESIIIALNRQLNSDHPIMKLLKPHCYNTIAINDLGRNTLLANNDSTFDRILSTGVQGGLELMNKAYVKWFNFTERIVPNEFKVRGFYEVKDGAKDNLPGYYYRDDAHRIFYAIRDYVTSVLALPEVYSGKDAKVFADLQLRGLKRELEQKANVHGVPELTSIDALADFLAQVIFMASAQHSAVNFGQYDFYSFIPNRPLILTEWMPEDPSLVTEKFLMSALPDFAQAKETISTARVLSLPPHVAVGVYTGQVIGGVLNGLQKDAAYPQQYSTFVDNLGHIEDTIKTRNAGFSGIPYPDYDYLSPIRIAASIAI